MLPAEARLLDGPPSCMLSTSCRPRAAEVEYSRAAAAETSPSLPILAPAWKQSYGNNTSTDLSGLVPSDLDIAFAP